MCLIVTKINFIFTDKYFLEYANALAIKGIIMQACFTDYSSRVQVKLVWPLIRIICYYYSWYIVNYILHKSPVLSHKNNNNEKH